MKDRHPIKRTEYDVHGGDRPRPRELLDLPVGAMTTKSTERSKDDKELLRK
jgi:hypothetical protein